MLKTTIYKFFQLRVLVIVKALLIVCIQLHGQDDMLTDHRYATLEDLKDIPQEWIVSAKNKLHIRYEHTSHGSQITRGMANLDAFMGGNGIYVYANNGGPGVLDLHDISESDLSTGENTWQQKTRDYLARLYELSKNEGVIY